MYRLCSYMLNAYARRWIPFDEEIELSREHFRESIGTDYSTPLQRLKTAGVVITDEQYYFPGEHAHQEGIKGQCKRYRFNPELIYSDPEIIELDMKARRLHDTEDEAIALTLPILRNIRFDIDRRKIKAWVKQEVTEAWVMSQCVPGHKLPPGRYKVRGLKHPLSLEKIKESSGRREFWSYKGKVYMSGGDYIDLESFVHRHTRELRMIYAQKAVELKGMRSNAVVYCSRNDRNRRLDHNLTNTRSHEPCNLLKHVTLDGEHLVGIDLKNSQFTFLAHFLTNAKQHISTLYDVEEHNILAKTAMRAAAKHHLSLLGSDIVNDVRMLHEELIIKDTLYICDYTFSTETALRYWFSEDLDTFQKCAKAGNLYTYLGEVLTIEMGRFYTRSEAKQVAFEVLFSAARNNTPEKEAIRTRMPNFIAMCDAFKTAHIKMYMDQGRPKKEALDMGNAALAVFLQRIESVVFIDRILIDLLRRGYRVLSKHDSILAKRSEVEAVHRIVTEHLDAVLGRGAYQLAIED